MASLRGKSCLDRRLSAGESDEITLNARGFFGAFELQIDLVEIAATPQQQAPWRHWRQAILPQPIVPLDEILHAGVRNDYPLVFAHLDRLLDHEHFKPDLKPYVDKLLSKAAA